VPTGLRTHPSSGPPPLRRRRAPGGGQPRSNARKGRSLAVDQPCASQIFPGVRHDMAHAGGRSHAVERLGEAAAIMRINRRRKALYGGFFSDSN
jgi:hypothetical protein